MKQQTKKAHVNKKGEKADKRTDTEQKQESRTEIVKTKRKQDGKEKEIAEKSDNQTSICTHFTHCSHTQSIHTTHSNQSTITVFDRFTRPWHLRHHHRWKSSTR